MQKLIALGGIALLCISAGCGSERDGGIPKPSEGPSAPGTQRPGDDKDKTGTPPALLIQVFRDDADIGIAAEIDRLDDTGTPHFVANVNDTGIARLAQPCSPSDRFQAEPKVEAYLKVAPQSCAATVTFRLPSAQATYEMIRIGESDERRGNFAAAQAKFGQAADRLQYSKPLEAEQLRLRVNANVGKILGVDRPTVSVNGKEKVTPQMTDRVKLYQQKAHLPVTGEIDKQTRDKLLAERGTHR